MIVVDARHQLLNLKTLEDAFELAFNVTHKTLSFGVVSPDLLLSVLSLGEEVSAVLIGDSSYDLPDSTVWLCGIPILINTVRRGCVDLYYDVSLLRPIVDDGMPISSLPQPDVRVFNVGVH